MKNAATTYQKLGYGPRETVHISQFLPKHHRQRWQKFASMRLKAVIAVEGLTFSDAETLRSWLRTQQAKQNKIWRTYFEYEGTTMVRLVIVRVV